MTELEKAKQQLEQTQHRIDRLENRKNYLGKQERRIRSHRLITKGAAIESIAPGLKNFPETVFYSLMEKIFSLSEVQRIVREEITLQAEKKEGDNDG